MFARISVEANQRVRPNQRRGEPACSPIQSIPHQYPFGLYCAVGGDDGQQIDAIGGGGG